MHEWSLGPGDTLSSVSMAWSRLVSVSYAGMALG